ncbi:MAG: NAD(P)/FAD-dependent oxidoreductase [Candidatus Methanoperedens sp.]|nr:NAD(P)/FAD-dependent oxidoreductase [Candidatus Methanoperedens sp.]
MDKMDVIIIGGGASGLAAGKEIAKAGKKVCVLEARNRLGGRIHTLTVPGFSTHIEAGAEFVHGDMPSTKSLLKEGGIEFYSTAGKYYRIKNGKLQKLENLWITFLTLLSKAYSLKQDMPFSKFSDQYLNEEKFKDVRETARAFVEGYDAADVNRASTFALREEWKNFRQSDQYRLKGGHIKLIDFLSKEIIKHSGEIFLSTVVKEIRWKPDNVEVISDKGKIYSARKALITVPLGVLQSKPDDEAHILFSPGLPGKLEAANSIGYGTATKVFLEFKEAFWESSENQIRKMPKLGLLISDTPFTACWTQLPNKTPLLTGWLAGPQAEKNKNTSDENIINMALDALSYIFNADRSFLTKNLHAGKAVNWQTDPFSLGAYSYATVESNEAKKTLAQPVEDTLFFAGEALSEGTAMGTAEEALANGIKTAKELLTHL